MYFCNYITIGDESFDLKKDIRTRAVLRDVLIKPNRAFREEQNLHVPEELET